MTLTKYITRMYFWDNVTEKNVCENVKPKCGCIAHLVLYAFRKKVSRLDTVRCLMDGSHFLCYMSYVYPNSVWILLKNVLIKLPRF